MPRCSLSRRTSSHTAARLDRIETRCRLVEEQHLRLVHERGGEVETTLHPAGVRADPAIDRLADVDQHQQFGDPLRRRSADEPVEPALQVEQFATGLLGIERRLLQGDTDAQADHVGPSPTSKPATVAVPRRQQQRRQHAHGGALPGAVRAEEAIDLASGNVEIDAVDGDGFAESTGERSGLQRRVSQIRTLSVAT